MEQASSAGGKINLERGDTGLKDPVLTNSGPTGSGPKSSSSQGPGAPASVVTKRLKASVKPIVFFAALAPFIYLVFELFTGGLGPNPIDSLTDSTGTLAIRMLLISLALTPLRFLLKQTWPLRLRRMLGLFAFFYASLHAIIYWVLDQQLDLALVWDDLEKRPYIMAGTTAFLLLLPLAVTSTRKMVKRLGRRWSALHRGVYLASTAAVVHYVWLAKGDLVEPLIYLGILIFLLGFRFVKVLK